MEFREKIDKILKIKNIALWRLAEESGLHSTLEKAYKENREMRATTTRKFLQNMDINPTWWATNSGEILVATMKIETFRGSTKPDPLWYEKNNGPHKIEDGDYYRVHRRAWDQMDMNLAQSAALLTEIQATHKKLVESNAKLMENYVELVKTLQALQRNPD